MSFQKYNFKIWKCLVVFAVTLITSCGRQFCSKNLSVILPDKSTIEDIKTYDDLEPFEEKMLALLPINSLNIKAKIVNKMAYLNDKQVFYEEKKEMKPSKLNIKYKVDEKELIIDEVKGYYKSGTVFMEGKYGNKNVFIKVFGKAIHKNNKEYCTKIEKELTRHIFVNSISKSIGPEIYFITKDEQGNVFLIMEKLEFDEKELRKDPYKWIKTIYEHLSKLHKHNFYHTDPNPNNIIGYKLLDFAYIDSGGMFFDDSENPDLDLKTKDIAGFAMALFHKIYAWNKEDIVIKPIIRSFLYGEISKEVFLEKIYAELKKRNEVDLYARFLIKVVLNEEKKYKDAESVLQDLKLLKN